MKNKMMTLDDLLDVEFETYDFDGYWYDAFGKPEICARWSVQGDSGSGKTSFLLKLAGYFTKFGTVCYISSEEGQSESIKQAVLRSGLTKEQRGDILIEEHKEYKKSLWFMYRNPKVKLWILDSLDSFGLTFPQVETIVNHKKLQHSMIAMVQWSNNKGRLSNSGSKHLAEIKVEVKHFVATANSRYGGNRQPFIINKELAGKHYAWVNRL